MKHKYFFNTPSHIYKDSSANHSYQDHKALVEIVKILLNSPPRMEPNFFNTNPWVESNDTHSFQRRIVRPVTQTHNWSALIPPDNSVLENNPSLCVTVESSQILYLYCISITTQLSIRKQKRTKIEAEISKKIYS